MGGRTAHSHGAVIDRDVSLWARRGTNYGGLLREMIILPFRLESFLPPGVVSLWACLAAFPYHEFGAFSRVMGLVIENTVRGRLGTLAWIHNVRGVPGILIFSGIIRKQSRGLLPKRPSNSLDLEWGKKDPEDPSVFSWSVWCSILSSWELQEEESWQTKRGAIGQCYLLSGLQFWTLTGVTCVWLS